MVRIARKLTTDKRTKSRISVDVHKGLVILSFNELTLKLKRVEAEMIAEKLDLAVQIQDDRKARNVEQAVLKMKELKII